MTRAFRASTAVAEEAASLARRSSASRAGSPLLFGLAPRGVFRASAVASGAVGSYPTFSPLPNGSALPGRSSPSLLEDVSQVYLQDATVQSRRRSVLCGTFREPWHRRQPVSCSPRRNCRERCKTQTEVCATAPLALPGALPLTLKPFCTAAGFGVRTFLPPRLLGASDHPAHPPTRL